MGVDFGKLHATLTRGEPSEWDEPSKAVLASDGHDGVVLWTIGPHVEHELKEGGLQQLSELGLDDAPAGICVWEGTYVWRPGPYEYPLDGDSEAVGAFRDPTEEEWLAIKKNQCPWERER